MSALRAVFFGTPAFAVPSLRKLLESRHSVAAVVTQPDRPAGRGMRRLSPTVKETTLASGKVPILQPADLLDPGFLSQVGSFGADLAVVVAYGRILPPRLLKIFPKRGINLHASLLPQYRGAAPIAWALIQGETETGVTVFQLDEQLDHGPVLLQGRRTIQPEDNGVTLSVALARLGAELLIQALDQIESGSVRPQAQDDSQATEAPRLKKEDGFLDWKLPAIALTNRIRGLQPWPGAITHLKGQLLKILAAQSEKTDSDPKAAAGTVVLADPSGGIWVQTGKGKLKIERLQLAGGKPLSAAEFLRGHPMTPGTLLT